MKPITEVAALLGLSEEEIILYGRYKAKVHLSVLNRLQDRSDGRLVLVSGMTPTPAGEGKSTVTIGLGQALCRLGKKAIAVIREPSLGPCFGIKGGACGGGYAQVVPMEDINLHFTGDFHAVTSAHNLLAAAVDNHLHQGNRLRIDPRQVVWRRVMDMNERALRSIVIGLGGRANGVPRESGFDITAASEVMACLCLVGGLADLKRRLRGIIVAYTDEGRPVTAQDMGAAGAMAALLREALCPNLVQTLENTPAFVHGGPFGNIAHGCNSLLATKLGLKLADYLITEAGFGFDLGGEKFLDIKCPYGGLRPDAVVLVVSIRALKFHGGVDVKDLAADRTPNPAAVERGLPNLEKHLENARLFGLPVVVAINRFSHDSRAELGVVARLVERLGAEVAVTEVWEKGGEGGVELAEKLLDTIKKRPTQYRPLYDWSLPVPEKIEKIATEIYGAKDVVFTPQALTGLKKVEEIGLNSLPVCMAKTQSSLSDNPKLIGRPEGWTLTVREVRISAGAGFIVALSGEIMTMPGLPKVPAAEKIDIDACGVITGLF